MNPFSGLEKVLEMLENRWPKWGRSIGNGVILAALLAFFGTLIFGGLHGFAVLRTDFSPQTPMVAQAAQAPTTTTVASPKDCPPHTVIFFKPEISGASNAGVSLPPTGANLCMIDPNIHDNKTNVEVRDPPTSIGDNNTRAGANVPPHGGGVTAGANISAGSNGGGSANIEAGTGSNGASGGDVHIGPGNYTAGNGGPNGPGGNLNIKAGDAK